MPQRLDDGDTELYPGDVLKQDKHYFTRDEYDTEGENGPSKRAFRERQMLSRRKDHFTTLLEYKAEEHGILVDRTSERDTRKTCSCCGRKRDSNRVERGLYVCESCGASINTDVNGAVNIRRKITQNPPTEDSGRFAPSEQASSKPSDPNCGRDSSAFTRRRMSMLRPSLRWTARGHSRVNGSHDRVRGTGHL